MLLEFEKKLADFIITNGLLGSAEKILLAVSGGADSIALLHALHALKTEGIINSMLSCAHINHQLRGDAGNSDEEFVAAQAAELKMDVTTRPVDVCDYARSQRLSIETAARNLRMAALIDIAKANNCNRIATAHQKNDNAETIIQRLSRGTGFRGLGGIWPQRAFADEIKFIRPLLCFTRDEIVEYLQQRNLQWRRDHTNNDCTFRRNYIRHKLMPVLQKDCSESIVEQLSKLAHLSRRYYSKVCNRADKLWPSLAKSSAERTVLDVNLSLAEPKPVKVELIRQSLANINCGERYITQQHYEAILQLSEQNITGRIIELPGGFVVRREYNNLIFSGRMGNSYLRHEFAHAESVSETAWAGEPAHPTTIEIPGQIKFEHFLIQAIILEKDETDFENFKSTKTDFIEWFDLDRIKPPLTVRHRCAGDRFAPLSHSAEKKIGKFLTAQRIPHEIRKQVIVVADEERIIWVWPVRMSEKCKVYNETQKILQLQITNLES